MRITNEIRNRAAIFFVIAFVSTLLIKPLHILSHNFHDNCISQTTDKQEKGHHDCSICHFTLSAYTPQEFTRFISLPNLPETRISDKIFETFPQERLSVPSLRAPPAFTLS